jgi:uncharacterized protein YeaO (DUF488 family)
MIATALRRRQKAFGFTPLVTPRQACSPASLAQKAPADDLMTVRRFGSPKKLVCRYGQTIYLFGSNAKATSMNEKLSGNRVMLKRAYERPSAEDGTRVLVDRLWPRGVKKSGAAIDHWAKELAPSTELRKWFGHDPARWEEFRSRYSAEIYRHGDELDRLRNLVRKGAVTLVYAAHDEAHNDAVVLREILLADR